MTGTQTTLDFTKQSHNLGGVKITIADILRTTGLWLSAEEVSERVKARGIYKGSSGNNCASRLWEMERGGFVESRKRKGKNYKEWNLR